MKCGQCERELGAAFRRVLHPQLSMMRPNDVARNAQPHSCPGHRFLCSLSTIKTLKDRIEFVWRNARAMITDCYCDGVAGLACRYSNRRLRRGILDGIAQQLPDREADYLWICIDG